MIHTLLFVVLVLNFGIICAFDINYTLYFHLASLSSGTDSHLLTSVENKEFSLTSPSSSSESVSEIVSPHFLQYSQNDEVVTETQLARNRRIIGGTDTDIRHYPYMVAILLFSGLNCGGTVINTKWIMTAAHCAWNFSKDRFYSPREIVIMAGSTIWIPKEKSPSRQTRNVKSIKTTNFQIDPAENDIALLMLVKELTFTESVQPVTLSTKQWFKDNAISMLLDPCEILGWGKDESGNKSRILKKVETNLIPTHFCKRLLDVQGVTERVSTLNLCTLAPQGGKDFCKADSGGPLICKDTQVGIVFGNFGCGLRSLPSLWTRVDTYEDWINNIVNKIEPRSDTSNIIIVPNYFILICLILLYYSS